MINDDLEIVGKAPGIVNEHPDHHGGIDTITHQVDLPGQLIDDGVDALLMGPSEAFSPRTI